jgi:hypothetical protein
LHVVATCRRGDHWGSRSSSVASSGVLSYLCIFPFYVWALFPRGAHQCALLTRVRSWCGVGAERVCGAGAQRRMCASPSRLVPSGRKSDSRRRSNGSGSSERSGSPVSVGSTLGSIVSLGRSGSREASPMASPSKSPPRGDGGDSPQLGRGAGGSATRGDVTASPPSRPLCPDCERRLLDGSLRERPLRKQLPSYTICEVRDRPWRGHWSLPCTTDCGVVLLYPAARLCAGDVTFRVRFCVAVVRRCNSTTRPRTAGSLLTTASTAFQSRSWRCTLARTCPSFAMLGATALSTLTSTQGQHKKNGQRSALVGWSRVGLSRCVP